MNQLLVTGILIPDASRLCESKGRCGTKIDPSTTGISEHMGSNNSGGWTTLNLTKSSIVLMTLPIFLGHRKSWSLPVSTLSSLKRTQSCSQDVLTSKIPYCFSPIVFHKSWLKPPTRIPSKWLRPVAFVLPGFDCLPRWWPALGGGQVLRLKPTEDWRCLLIIN